MTRLRTREGLDLGYVEERHGKDVREGVERGAEFAVNAGIAVVEEDTLRLEDPDGFLFSNTVVRQIFYELGIGEE